MTTSFFSTWPQAAIRTLALLTFGVLSLFSPSLHAQPGNIHLTFDGVDDYATLTDWVPPGVRFTVELWVKPGETTNGQAFISKHPSGPGNLFIIGYYRDNLHVRVQETAFEAASDQRTTDWHHVAVTVNQNLITLYVNGDEVGSSAFSETLNLEGRPWLLGQEWDDTRASDFFRGDIDNVILWGRALPAREIKARYHYRNPMDVPNRPASFFPPTRHWRLDGNLRSEFGTEEVGTREGDPGFFWSNLHLVADAGRYPATELRIVTPAGKCLEIENSATGNGVVQQWDCIDTVSSQRHTLVPFGDGHEIRPAHTTNHCITVEGEENQGLETVIQQECIGLRIFGSSAGLRQTQIWRFRPILGSSGGFTIRALHDEARCLSVPAGQENSNGADLRFLPCSQTGSREQTWFLRPGDTNNQFTPYELVSSYSPSGSFCMDSGTSGAGADVTPQACGGPGTLNQRFYFDTTGDADYEIRSRESPTHCLTVAGGSTDTGVNVGLASGCGGQNQQWALRPALDAFQLVAAHSGKCAGSKFDRTTVLQQTCTLTPHRVWYLIPDANVVADEVDTAGHEGEALGGNHPNPFVTTTAIPFSLSSTQYVQLTVHNVLGQEVAILVDGIRSVGSHEVTFDATDLPSGVYIVRLATGSTTLTQRMTVVR